MDLANQLLEADHAVVQQYFGLTSKSNDEEAAQMQVEAGRLARTKIESRQAGELWLCTKLLKQSLEEGCSCQGIFLIKAATNIFHKQTCMSMRSMSSDFLHFSMMAQDSHHMRLSQQFTSRLFQPE